MTVKEKVIEVLCATNAQIEDNLETNLLEAGLIDSYEIVELVMSLEDAFDIMIDPELVVPENFQTVTAITDLIERICDENK